MYSNEIQNWLSVRNYCLTTSEYIWLINQSNSSQIDHIKNEGIKIHLWTNDKYDWGINIVNNR